MASLNYLIVAVLCLSTRAVLCEAAGRIPINNNLTVAYEVVNNQTLRFDVEARIKGWVSLGFNEVRTNITDFFRGYVIPPSVATGADYYVPVNGNIANPIRDTVQNWSVGSGSETNSTGNVTITRISFSRPLDTRDRNHDIVIQNRTITMYWAYNLDSDDLNRPASANGSVQINLLRSINGNRFVGRVKRENIGSASSESDEYDMSEEIGWDLSSIDDYINNLISEI